MEQRQAGYYREFNPPGPTWARARRARRNVPALVDFEAELAAGTDPDVVLYDFMVRLEIYGRKLTESAAIARLLLKASRAHDPDRLWCVAWDAGRDYITPEDVQHYLDGPSTPRWAAVELLHAFGNRLTPPEPPPPDFERIALEDPSLCAFIVLDAWEVSRAAS